MTGEARLTPEAQADIDIDTAETWYRDRSPDAARRFLLAARDTLSRVGANPLHGAEIVPGARRRVMRGYPFNVWYSPRPFGAVVFAVLHSRRPQDIALVRAIGLKP